ncbi:MAG: hypothetical protein Kilf2KO_25000 [Rhodospirillales bacterium]
MADVAEEKAALRRQAKASRDRAAAENATAAVGFLEHLLKVEALPPGTAISAYWPMGSEIDVRPAVQHLHDDGHRIVLPVMQGAGRPLLFKVWQPGEALQPGAYGTSEPLDEAEFAVPEVLIVPLLAFDRKGYRLGYGGGFYDRTLAELRRLGHIMAIGAAFAAQEVARVPRDATDLALDWVVTEREAFAVA